MLGKNDVNSQFFAGGLTVPVNSVDDLAPGTLNSILKQSGLKKYG